MDLAHPPETRWRGVLASQGFLFPTHLPPKTFDNSTWKLQHRTALLSFLQHWELQLGGVGEVEWGGGKEPLHPKSTPSLLAGWDLVRGAGLCPYSRRASFPLPPSLLTVATKSCSMGLHPGCLLGGEGEHPLAAGLCQCKWGPSPTNKQ